MTHLKLLLIVSISLFASACATLNKSECLNADWQIIGLEDGSKGRGVAYIGQHREACAEYGVVPDLVRYKAGHETGLRRFCTAEVGFSQGKRGYRYNGVCPADVSGDFLYGYERGHELYSLNRDIKRIKREIESSQLILQGMGTEINELELQLISKAGSASDRLAMIQNLKELQSNQTRLETDIDNLELDAARLQGEYDVLKVQYAF